jgi:hypothetical protein
VTLGDGGALGGTRTPNLLIRSQMLYPLSYERSHCRVLHSEPSRRVPEICPRPTVAAEGLWSGEILVAWWGIVWISLSAMRVRTGRGWPGS